MSKTGAHLAKSDAEHLRRSQVVNNLNRGYVTGGPNYASRGKKIFSSYLVEFFESHPAKRKKLLMKAIEYAEKGNARFLELIITLVEGPIKDKEPSGNTYNFNFMSEGDRERALSSVDRIKRMAQSIPVLPEETDESTSGSGEGDTEESIGSPLSRDELEPDE